MEKADEKIIEAPYAVFGIQGLFAFLIKPACDFSRSYTHQKRTSRNEDDILPRFFPLLLRLCGSCHYG